MKKTLLSCALALGLMGQAYATEQITVPMTDVVSGHSAGNLVVAADQAGTIFYPQLTKMTGGLHQLTLLKDDNCSGLKGITDSRVLAAKGNKQLPGIYVTEHDGSQNMVMVPQLTVSQLQGKALVIDMTAQQDGQANKTDAQLVCGVI